MVPMDRLAQIARRFEFVEAKLSAGAPPAEIATLSREYSELKPMQDQLESAGMRLRYGVVPFSSTVNVGKLDKE